MRLFLTGALLILLWVLATLPSYPDMDYPGQKVLRIYTANIFRGNDEPANVAKIIRASRAQIVLLLEYTGKNFELEILQRKGYRVVVDHPRPGIDGLCLLARDVENIKAELTEIPTKNTCKRSVATMSFSIRDNRFSFIGISAPPQVAGCNEGRDKVIGEVLGWINNGRMRFEMGATRQRDLVIVAGDFDAISLSSSVRRLKTRGLKDAFAESNWRPGPTWAPAVISPALLRVDYIFSGMSPQAAKTIYLPGSHHRGVVADFRFQR